ncbi:STAS domain-containing protein [Kitasatospora sp. NPDC004240]
MARESAAGAQDPAERARADGTGPRLTVSVRQAGDTRVVSPAGEIDHDTADELRGALLRPAPPGSVRVLVDFAEVGFCDSTGLNILLRARLAAEEDGLRLEVAGLRPAVARLFDITGADTVLRVHPDLAAALVRPHGGETGGRP